MDSAYKTTLIDTDDPEITISGEQRCMQGCVQLMDSVLLERRHDVHDVTLCRQTLTPCQSPAGHASADP
jgi:hypothetical protein